MSTPPPEKLVKVIKELNSFVYETLGKNSGLRSEFIMRFPNPSDDIFWVVRVTDTGVRDEDYFWNIEHLILFGEDENFWGTSNDDVWKERGAPYGLNKFGYGTYEQLYNYYMYLLNKAHQKWDKDRQESEIVYSTSANDEYLMNKIIEVMHRLKEEVMSRFPERRISRDGSKTFKVKESDDKKYYVFDENGNTWSVIQIEKAIIVPDVSPQEWQSKDWKVIEDLSDSYGLDVQCAGSLEDLLKYYSHLYDMITAGKQESEIVYGTSDIESQIIATVTEIRDILKPDNIGKGKLEFARTTEDEIWSDTILLQDGDGIVVKNAISELQYIFWAYIEGLCHQKGGLKTENVDSTYPFITISEDFRIANGIQRYNFGYSPRAKTPELLLAYWKKLLDMVKPMEREIVYGTDIDVDIIDTVTEIRDILNPEFESEIIALKDAWKSPIKLDAKLDCADVRNNYARVINAMGEYSYIFWGYIEEKCHQKGGLKADKTVTVGVPKKRGGASFNISINDAFRLANGIKFKLFSAYSPTAGSEEDLLAYWQKCLYMVKPAGESEIVFGVRVGDYSATPLDKKIIATATQVREALRAEYQDSVPSLREAWDQSVSVSENNKAPEYCVSNHSGSGMVSHLFWGFIESLCHQRGGLNTTDELIGGHSPHIILKIDKDFKKKNGQLYDNISDAYSPTTATKHELLDYWKKMLDMTKQTMPSEIVT